MKKTLSFLLTLVMCVSIMPTIASASSETGRMQDEYDPETGYTTITTDGKHHGRFLFRFPDPPAGVGVSEPPSSV